MNILTSGNSKDLCSRPIRKLDPFLDERLICVGGRLDKSSMPTQMIHPVSLPEDHHLSVLIPKQIHSSLLHCGINQSHVSQVKRAVLAYSCSVRDKEYYIKMRHKSKVEEQKMARLKDGIIPDEPPFSLVGVDNFGPFEVKVKRSHVKRYGVIFTCLASRAVHLEVAASLDTDSYINALRRFMARRGHVKRIRSDNGTWTGSLIRRISSRRNRGKDYQINPKGNE